ncbi:unnamed protein product [marine sediment metagenome]|uniref:Uncharacterized protein n=1 Tax=marine sediment metagenome TaxID=412755 RepID=X1TJ81_9ZZZZ
MIMPKVLTAKDWQPWHDEIKRYARRDTEGLDKDLAALEAHIKKLRAVAPKDSAGYRLHTNALIYLNTLQTRLDGIKSYLGKT